METRPAHAELNAPSRRCRADRISASVSFRYSSASDLFHLRPMAQAGSLQARAYAMAVGDRSHALRFSMWCAQIHCSIARSSTSHPPSYPQIDPSESVLNEPDAQGGSDSDRDRMEDRSPFPPHWFENRAAARLPGNASRSSSPAEQVGPWPVIRATRLAAEAPSDRRAPEAPSRAPRPPWISLSSHSSFASARCTVRRVRPVSSATVLTDGQQK
jgi:hypothetical protein